MTDIFSSFYLLVDTPKGEGPGTLLGSPMTLAFILFAMFYLLMIRPAQKQRKEQEARIASIEKGDKVITNGGLHGTVHQISERTVTLKPGGENVFLTFDKPSIASVQKLKSEKAAASKDEKTEKSEKK